MSERQATAALTAVMGRLEALGIDPIAVASARGGSHIHVEVEPGWDLSVAEVVRAYTE